MIDIGGHRLAMTSQGAGSPAVVFETGLGAESGEWAAVEAQIIGARTLRYDRANRGSSDPLPGPRSALQMVDDLDRLLRVASIEPPYILVGHSFGGLLARVFAHRHSDRVASLVLVDAMHEDQFETFAPLFPPAEPSEPAELTRVRAFWQGGWRSPEATVEKIDFTASLSQAREVRSLGDIPLHVIIAGTYLHQPLIPPSVREPLQSRWQAQQLQFLKLSTESACSFALGSGHFIQRDQPSSIGEAINTMVAQVRMKHGGIRK